MNLFSFELEQTFFSILQNNMEYVLIWFNYECTNVVVKINTFSSFAMKYSYCHLLQTAYAGLTFILLVRCFTPLENCLLISKIQLKFFLDNPFCTELWMNSWPTEFVSEQCKKAHAYVTARLYTCMQAKKKIFPMKLL